MHIAAQLGERGTRIVESARARMGATVVKPDQLAAAVIGLWLAPHEGEPLTQSELAIMASEGGYVGAVQYDARLPQPIQDRIIARACAAWLIDEAGDESADAALVDYVASALCGSPRPLVKAVAAAADSMVERVKARHVAAK